MTVQIVIFEIRHFLLFMRKVNSECFAQMRQRPVERTCLDSGCRADKRQSGIQDADKRFVFRIDAVVVDRKRLGYCVEAIHRFPHALAKHGFPA